MSTLSVSNWLKPRTQMQMDKKMDKVVIGDYHHMMASNEYMNWMKLTNLLRIQFAKPRGLLFVHLMYFKILSSLFKCTH